MNRFFHNKKHTLRRMAPFLAVLLLLSGVFQCREENNRENSEKQTALEIVQEWNRLALELERYTPGYRPPVSARMFAYLGMAAYEASLPSIPENVSLEWYCKGYKAPVMPKAGFWLPAGINAAYAETLRHFFPEAPNAWRGKVDQLEKKWEQHSGTNPDVLRNSVDYGRKVAMAVWKWSATDPKGHEANLYIYDRNYQPPVGAGKWRPDAGHPMPALLPYWGQTRRFATWADTISCLPPIAYDTIPGSPYHTEALEVFTLAQNLSKENHWIAEFWSDDVAGLTLSPSGRWIKIANQAIDKSDLTFVEALETYLKIGFALNDAAVACWNSKYLYNVQRPDDYIRSNIQTGWKPLHDSPSFPSYPSGHSAFGAAAAEILSSQLGDEFTLTDRTHDKRREFASMPRSYDNFREMALENAASRIYLGVHFRMDCTEGLRIGKKIGLQILSLKLKRDELAVKS